MKIDMYNGDHATDADKIRIFFNEIQPVITGVGSAKIITSLAILLSRIQRKLIYIFRSLQ